VEASWKRKKSLSIENSQLTAQDVLDAHLLAFCNPTIGRWLLVVMAILWMLPILYLVYVVFGGYMAINIPSMRSIFF
jgi:hypothetical protein